MKKICIISTRSLSIKTFFLDNLFFLNEHNYEISIICEPDKELMEILNNKIKYIPVKMKRGNVSLISLLRYINIFRKIFKKEKYDLIQYVSCNASLYASIGGWLAKIKHRIACEWGYTYIGYTGLKRFIYKNAERIICLFSTVVQPDSFSNLQFGIEQKIFSNKKGQVIWNGSASGVNLNVFDFKFKNQWRSEIRKKYGIPNDAFVFGFVGRLMRDKGINELLAAFKYINQKNIYLLLVGPTDEFQDLNIELIKWASLNCNIIKVGLVDEPQKYYASMDFLILPSYREGFGMVILEAAALKVPAIATAIRGPIDFIKNGFNGILCDVKSSKSLFYCMKKAINMPKIDYELMANNAYEEVLNKFDQFVFREKFLENKNEILGV